MVFDILRCKTETKIKGYLPIRPLWARGPGGQEVRMRKGYYACAFPVRPVRALKAVSLEDSLKEIRTDG